MPNPIDMPSPDTDMAVTESHYWEFYPITTGTSQSEIYSDNNRYVIVRTVDEGTVSLEEVPMDTADKSDYNEFLLDEDTSYIKMEISQGGRSTRTNFHDDALVGSFVVQNNRYFEIIGQEGGHIIDVYINDITKTYVFNPDADPDYIIPQQKAWKAVEWYMSDSRTQFLGGEINAINLSSKSIRIQVTGENIATTYGQGYFNMGSREFISFYDRFMNQYSHDINSNPRKLYSKYKGWYIHNSNGDSYPIERIGVQNRTQGESYEAIIRFTEEPTNFNVGDTVYATFSRTPVERRTALNGIYSVDVSDIPPPPGDTNVRICLDGYWLAPEFKVDIPSGTRLGLCGGRYWGLGDQAPDNDNAIIFMRTVEGIFGISSAYYYLSNEDLLLYYDYESKNVAIRRGTLGYTEYPKHYDISIGESAWVATASISKGTNSTIALDTGQDRVKLLEVEIPPGNDVLLFSLGSQGEYYGTTICGDGEMNLIGFERGGGVTQNKDLYTYDGNLVSPIYEYMTGRYSRTDSRRVMISAATGDGPIIISNPNVNVGPLINSANIDYINNNQVIDNARLFDIFSISDEELMIFMGRGFRGFTVQNSVSTVSNSGATEWPEKNGVFVIGSKNGGYFWGNPQLSDKVETNKDNQYGLLILDNALYCCSIYDELSEKMYIFFVSYDNGSRYLGVFIVNILTLSYQNFACVPEDSRQDFLWRPPAIENPTYNPNPVVDNFTFKFSDWFFEDKIIPIVSESTGVAQFTVDNIEDFGVVSSKRLADGSIVVFYDSLDGVRMIFSRVSGEEWGSSEIIVAKDGEAAIYDGGLLFYITETGIQAKIVTETLLNEAMSATAGSDANFIELIQETFDTQITTPLNTGPVQKQKLTAHEDDTGVFRIFYYDDDGKICSSEGTNQTWMVSNNF